jgi:hypothetical protein
MNKLIYFISGSAIIFIGMNFLVCNFMVPGSINRADVLGGLKNPPPTECNQSQDKNLQHLIQLLSIIIALKTNMNNDAQ